MDQQLVDLMSGGKTGHVQADFTFHLDTPGEIEVLPEGQTEKVRYMLKPLKELYVPGTDSPSVDPKDKRYEKLFMEIERPIVRYYEHEDPGLTDGAVGLALDQLAMDPDSPPAGDRLAQNISVSLRFCLSLTDYSRQEVRAALRKVRKSVERHSKTDGRRGYLDFIVEFFG